MKNNSQMKYQLPRFAGPIFVGASIALLQGGALKPALPGIIAMAICFGVASFFAKGNSRAFLESYALLGAFCGWYGMIAVASLAGSVPAPYVVGALLTLFLFLAGLAWLYFRPSLLPAIFCFLLSLLVAFECYRNSVNPLYAKNPYRSLLLLKTAVLVGMNTFLVVGVLRLRALGTNSQVEKQSAEQAVAPYR